MFQVTSSSTRAATPAATLVCFDLCTPTHVVLVLLLLVRSNLFTNTILSHICPGYRRKLLGPVATRTYIHEQRVSSNS
ncbi:hypothetical protein M408DRAFT_178423 [Serendipita vermifera MAFF 305830]|uniref:Uncharacterized protein n=1 Tax=Serendipita vermifera MAFF 305830 TaxID=933852 RepID=A0A0C2WKK8_SERVB|nr:hypothetical protein M408DRAFT_178423 [Serendipita vermifera MAFF 305830]